MEVVQIILDLLQSLGVNSTIWIQLVIFAFTFVFLQQVLFKPYLSAYLERIGRTSGSEDDADRIAVETQTLEQDYEVRARKINEDFNAIYQKNRLDAQKEYDRLMGLARESAQEVVERARLNVSEQLASAEKDLPNCASTLGTEMAASLIGKEIKQ